MTIPDWVPECQDCGSCCTRVLNGVPPFEENEEMHPSMANAIARLPVLPGDERGPCGLLKENNSVTQYRFKCKQYQHIPIECDRWERGGDECMTVLGIVEWPTEP